MKTARILQIVQIFLEDVAENPLRLEKAKELSEQQIREAMEGNEKKDQGLPEVKITRSRDQRGWVKGIVGPWRSFSAKVYDVGSKYGIDGGRISKLWISGLFNYDRGLDFGDLKDPHVRAIVAAFPEAEGEESQWPEHEKLKEIQVQSQAIGEFLETSRYVLAEYRPRFRTLDDQALKHLSQLDERVRKGNVWWVAVSGRQMRDLLGEVASGEPELKVGLGWRIPVRDEEEARERLQKVVEAGGYEDASVQDLIPVSGIERILAEYFGIDLAALEEEKREMLEEFRRLEQAQEPDPDEELRRLSEEEQDSPWHDEHEDEEQEQDPD